MWGVGGWWVWALGWLAGEWRNDAFLFVNSCSRRLWYRSRSSPSSTSGHFMFANACHGVGHLWTQLKPTISEHFSWLKSQERHHGMAHWRFNCISALKIKGDGYQPLNVSFSFYHRRNSINTSRLLTVWSCLSVISWERRGYGKFSNTLLSLPHHNII